MKRWGFLILWAGIASAAAAQVTLSDCVEKARNNYPQIQELGLIREAEKYDLSTASQSWLPQHTQILFLIASVINELDIFLTGLKIKGWCVITKSQSFVMACSKTSFVNERATKTLLV